MAWGGIMARHVHARGTVLCCGRWVSGVKGAGKRSGGRGEWEWRVNSEKVELMATGRQGGREEGMKDGV